jgi:hypothetical protein
LSSERTCISELRALGFLKPHAQHVSRTIHSHAEREIARPTLDAAAIADLEHQRIKEDDRIDVLQRSLLPRPGIIHDRVSDPTDQIPADLDTVDLGDVRLDIPRRQTPGVQSEDLVVNPSNRR